MGKFIGKNSKKDTNKNESLLVTKESVCSTFALFSFLAFLILCTRSLVFGELGLAVHSFLIGFLGYLAYPCLLGTLYLSLMGLFGKRLVKNRRFGVCLALAVIFAALVAHAAFTFRWEKSDYLKNCFYAGENFPKSTVCGLLGGLIVYGASAVLSNVGAIVVFSLFLAFFVYLCVLSWNASKNEKPLSAKTEKALTPREETNKKTITRSPIAPQQTERIPSNVEIVQQPGVRIEERDYRAPADDSYSPFGKVDQLKEETVSPIRAQSSREILFGGDPAENFARNLIFAQKSNANEPSNRETASSTYTPSYTDAYANSVNENTARPPMSVIDQTKTSLGSYEKDYEKVETQDEPIAPMSYLDPERPTPQETIEYPVFDKSEKSIEEERRETTFETLREENTDSSPRREFERGEENRASENDAYRLFDGERTVEDRTTPFNTERTVEDRTATFGGERYTLNETRFEGRGASSRDRAEESVMDNSRIFDEDPYALRAEETERSSFSERNPREEFTQRGERNDSYLERKSDFLEDRGGRNVDFSDRVTPVEKVEPPKAETPPEPKKPRVIRPYKRVPLDDFDCRDVEPTQNDEEVEQTKQDIIATLEEFKVVGATIASVTFGPTVTRYNVVLPRSVSPRKVVGLDQPIAISLRSSGVSVYPNFEDGVVSIEVPNRERQFVQLGCMLSGDTFVNAPSGSLMFAMGKNVANAKVYGDISKMIHLLVAGSSGSGKSVFLGALIVSMIYKYSPEELRLILIDPKKTEFVLYNNLPHLMINEILTDVNKAVQSLNWAIGEMNRRYSLFEKMSRSGQYVVNLDQYNEKLEKSERLPKIVIIIDELADLMLAAKKDIEDKIQNLTQKARAAGIHLIVATQRPSTDVITGVIKSNLSTRIAFGVASEVDSRVILDQSGAQKLLGKGDFLYSMPGINTPVRVQSAFISPSDSQRIVNFIKANNEAYYDEEATAFINNTRAVSDDPASGDKGDTIDPMYIEALRHVILSGSASISMIQRKCSAGYNRAGKIIEWMEDMGYISPFDGAKARKVLITKDDFETKYGPL